MEIKNQKTLILIVGMLMLVTGVTLPITIIAVASLWWLLKQI